MMYLEAKADVLKVKQKKKWRLFSTPELWQSIYFFGIFQLSLYLIGTGGLSDAPVPWTIGGILLGLGAIIHGLLTIRKRQNKKRYYELVRKRRVIGVVLGLFVFIYVVTYALLLIGIQPTVQPNQETVNLIMQTQRLPMVFMTVLVAPIVEELVFRELLPHAMGGGNVSYILASLLFVILHSPAGVVGWVMYGGISCAFLYLRIKGNNIMQATSGHILYNLLSSLLSFL